MEKEYWAYDTTSFSSYSKCLNQVRYGLNKDHDLWPQINLALLFGEESQLPFYYRKLAGNIPDVKTLKNLLADIDFLNYEKIKLVMDRGFYSADNINTLYKEHLKFLIAAKVSLKFVKCELDNVRGSLNTWNNYSHQYDLYSCTRRINGDYTQERPYKGDQITGTRRMYLHLYYSSERALEDERRLNLLLCRLQNELEPGQRNQDHEKQYSKYFDIKSTPVRGIQIIAEQDVIEEAKKNYGYFALISNEAKDAKEALQIYRNKDLVEKAFGDLKERLNCDRLAVSSELSLDGKLFVEFIALIFLSYVKKQMHDANLFKAYTMQELFDELDAIECFEQPGYDLRLSELTSRQIAVYEAMGFSPPSSLQ
jgi:transposase